jgi:hypothetical protein
MPEIDLMAFGSSVDNRKNAITNLLASYPLPWIVIHEVLQNSIDAIQKSTKSEGNVSVLLDLDNEAVEIEDNGRGFPFNPNLLLYGGTDKLRDPQARFLGGNIGVGLKVVLFSSNTFRLESVVDHHYWKLDVENAYDYEKLPKLVPKVEEPKQVNADSRTKIYYSFPDRKVTEFVEYVFNEFYHDVNDKLASAPIDKLKLAFEFYLRSYSYAGNLNRLLGISGSKRTTVSLKIVCTSAPKLSSITATALKDILSSNSPITVAFENKHWDALEAIKRTLPGYPSPQPITEDMPVGGKFTRQGPNYIYVKNVLGEAQLAQLINNPTIHDPPNLNEYKEFLRKIHGVYLVVGSVQTIEPYFLNHMRQFICAQGIPSDNLIKEPSGVGELGYLENIHFILNVDARLNFGKQVITNRVLLGQANKFFMDSFRATLRNIATAFAGKRKTTGPPPIRDILSRPDIPYPISIRKVPNDENEVIGIFYELIGKGILSDVRTYCISSIETYDGKIVMKLPTQKDFMEPSSNKDFQTIEFKIRVWDLIRDFESQTKDPSDVDLLVAWEDDYSNTFNPSPDYQAVNVKYVGIDDKVVPRVTKCIHARHIGRYIPIMILKDVISELTGSPEKRKS